MADTSIGETPKTTKGFLKDTAQYFFGNLMKSVIAPDRCIRCGGCIAACPVACIGFRNQKPLLVAKCEHCGVCYTHCPRTGLNFEEVEKALFGRTRTPDEEMGIFQEVVIAKARDEEILKNAQSGGVVTALLKYAKEKGYIDGAIVTKISEKEPWKPEPYFASTTKEIVNAAGSKFSVSPVVSLLGEVYHEYANYVGCRYCVNQVALVGLPCQIESLRKLQFSEHGALKIGDIVKLSISIFCWGNYLYENFKNFMESKGVNLAEITKFSIRENILTAYKGKEEVFSAKISELDSIKMKGCNECTDLTGELADISVGEISTPEGWSLVILRTELGRTLFKEAVEAGYLEVKTGEDVEKIKKDLIEKSAKKRQMNKANFEGPWKELMTKSHI
ncbi:MAG: Coenzyme F420 hydrogenase/dehydrogenase, beta subunit C-terminal domain [Candidatus Odinarchaeia archaeon]